MDPLMLNTLDHSRIFPELVAEALEKILRRRRTLLPSEILLPAGHGVTAEGLVLSFWALPARHVEPDPQPLTRCRVRLYRHGPQIAFRRVFTTITCHDNHSEPGTVLHFRALIDLDHCYFPVPFRSCAAFQAADH